MATWKGQIYILSDVTKAAAELWEQLQIWDLHWLEWIHGVWQIILEANDDWAVIKMKAQQEKKVSVYYAIIEHVVPHLFAV